MDDITELYCLMDDFCKKFEPLFKCTTFNGWLEAAYPLPLFFLGRTHDFYMKAYRLPKLSAVLTEKCSVAALYSAWLQYTLLWAPMKSVDSGLI
ncbi:hypothetical protein CCS41_10665 [Candidatus Fukatsuia symbiotica]|uniref:Uncharacterized protein n=1 Tax=Candidatus Fukatsuia symbiotica TaxID=1878942 RepID=A0A2U8I6V3_9GAMM|nr:hypothetical protein CCS41_10665 [Candidatus Fukatsuia symbiotica]